MDRQHKEVERRNARLSEELADSSRQVQDTESSGLLFGIFTNSKLLINGIRESI